MPQQAGIVVENSLINGLITEATGLNFPESACTETYNCTFDTHGSAYRRPGFDFENGYQTKTIDRDDQVVTSYLWQNVAGNGDVTVLVVQVGATLYFYEAGNNGSFSPGAVASTVTLTPVSGAPIIDTVEAQYSDGNGYLFVTHPYIEPIRVSYDITIHTATSTTISIVIRDFEGDVADPYAVTTRPTTTLAALDPHHHYNLLNQGWTETNLAAWDTAQTTMPSNADVMWRFKDSTDTLVFDAATIAKVTAGNTPAPKGHFILSLFDQNRNAIVTGATNKDTSFQRPSTSAFFSGRVFYAGLNYIGFNSNIYFTQIVERADQYGACHQINDPTSEDLFDLLPSDGGVISIPEAGTVYKLFTVPGGLCVFAANGVWFITGSQGIGFTATDYSVQKIANIGTLTASSFVNVAGLPCWWNADGIYILTAQSNSNLPTVQDMTRDKIKDFYDQIPLVSKRFVKGFYHSTDAHIRWIYRSELTSQVTQQYEYDRVLNFNVRTGAFYPWTISPSDVKVNAIIPTDLVSRPVSVDDVVDSLGNFVKDSLGNQVISFSRSGSNFPQFDKYLVSYPEAGSYKFTFANRNNFDYVDWFEYDSTGVNFDSYFITGYKLRGQAIRKQQNNWVRVFSNVDEAVSYYFQALWDYANTGDTGRWSSNQYVTHTDLDYSTDSKRLKVRGHGLAMQFKVSSIQGEPFYIIGWSAQQTVNNTP